MRRQLTNLVAEGTVMLLMFTSVSLAQEATTKADAALATNLEVMTRGPIHEAFATQFQITAVAGANVEREPPPPIEEIPPEVKPTGDDVIWIPGYWSWDQEATDFLWVSGTWRNAPPGRRWVPGYWNKAEGGFQWMSGFWIGAEVSQLAYHSAPPNSLERGPNSDAPGDNHFWVPGCAVPREDRYAWQPGYWCPYQHSHVWVPSYNVLTAGGYLHIPGYWDFRLDQRGVIFAPIRVNLAAHTADRIRFTPQVVIPVSTLQFHLFSQVNSHVYLFGDYYDERYAAVGIRPWYTVQFVRGVSEPLFGYYNWLYSRSGANYYLNVLTKWNAFYVSHTDLRPALTLPGQLDLAVRQQAAVNLTNSLLAAPLTEIVARTPSAFVNLSATESARIAASTTGLRVLSTDRINVEGRAGGALKLSGTANSAVKLNTQPLRLPVVVAPTPRANVVVPAHPSQLIRQAPNVAPNVRGNVGGNIRGGVVPPVNVPELKF